MFHPRTVIFYDPVSTVFPAELTSDAGTIPLLLLMIAIMWRFFFRLRRIGPLEPASGPGLPHDGPNEERG